MKTIIYEVEEQEFKDIQYRTKNHVIIKGQYEVGQKIILQGPDDEMPLTVGHVQVATGLCKGHCIISFQDACQPITKLPPVLEFDYKAACDVDQTIRLPHDTMSPSTSTILNEMLNESDDIGRLAAH